ncbi:unnamed protein product, partial [Amaranthus hypochondriacus]
MADIVINFATDKVLGPIMALLMHYTIKRIRYIKEYQKIASDLKDTVKKLVDKKIDFDKEVQIKEMEEEEITNTAKDWLDKVEEMLKNNELKALIKEADEIKNNKDDQCCSGCCHGSLEKRLTFGKKASEKIVEIKNLLTPPASSTIKVSGDKVKQKLEHLQSYQWDTREEVKKNLIMKVLDGQVLDLVGLCGDIGVGKTTLVKEILQKEILQKEIFQKTVMVYMGESPNLEDIQNKIAEVIGAKLDDKDKYEQNAVVLENHIRTKKENILIILDNLWAKVDLIGLGTGRNNEYCKHLIITRSENVCKLMDIPKDNTLYMKLMTDDEAIGFFWRVVYEKKSKNRMVDQITSYAYISLAKKLILNNCRRVPNVVAALANYLANLEIRDWKKLADELGKMNEEKREEKILHIQYENSEEHDKEKQMFFSLGCVFQPETRIPIHEWMRYAIGLDLIKIVDSLSEAMSEADTWIQTMISMSLLEEEDKPFMGGLGHVTISRQARDRLKHTPFGKIKLLDDIRRWFDLEKNSKVDYNAISLWSGRDHGRISGKEFINLEVLILDKSYPQDQFEDDFFYGMTNLKVLVLKKMKFKEQLPTSLRRLKDKLSLLHLETCELGEDLSLIGDLVNLFVLSFRDSKMEKFPANEIRKLSKLVVLDLYNCTITPNRIPADVLNKLAKLEGFYAYNRQESDWADLTTNNREESDWADLTTNNREESDWVDLTIKRNKDSEDSTSEFDQDKNASLEELNKLDELNVLEIKVPHLHQLPKNKKFVKKLQHFYIFVGKESQEVVPISAKGFSRILRFGKLQNGHEATKYECVQHLLAKTDLISLEEMKDTDFFVQKKETKADTPEIKIDVAEYTNLKVLKMYGCDGMKGFAAKPLKAPNLTDIEVTKCNNLNFLFIEHNKDSRYEYNSIPLLKNLVLKKLAKLGCISSPDTTGNEAFAALFDGKVICPLLEKLVLVKCGQITQIWSNSSLEISSWTERFKPSLQYLKEVSIKDCQKLQHVCSLAIAAAFDKLKRLEIKSCSLLKTVIKANKKDYKDYTNSNDNIKIFPALEELILAECYNVKAFFSHEINSHGNRTFELPSLGMLRIQECPGMDTFSNSSIEIKTPKLWWLTVEPCTHPKKEIKNINEFLKKQNVKPRKSNEESSETDDVATNDLGKKSVGCANFTCFGDKLKEP